MVRGWFVIKVVRSDPTAATSESRTQPLCVHWRLWGELSAAACTSKFTVIRGSFADTDLRFSASSAPMPPYNASSAPMPPYKLTDALHLNTGLAECEWSAELGI